MEKLRRRAPQHKSTERKRDVTSIGEIKKVIERKQVEKIEENELQSIPVHQERTSISKEATEKKQAEEIDQADLEAIPVLKHKRSTLKRNHVTSATRWRKDGWRKDEEERFISAVLLHGKKVKKLAEFVGTKSAPQCSSKLGNLK